MRFHRIHFSAALLILSTFIASLLMAQSLSANEPKLDNASLWLPKAYESHLNKLIRAAIVIKETEKCHRLLSGKLIEGRSKSDHLIFAFRCRTIERYSFSIEYDNNTQQIKDPYEPFRLREVQARLLKEDQERLLNEQKEQQLLQKELDREQQEKAACRLAMKQRIDEFNKPKIIKDSLAGPIIEDNVTIYKLVFDSLSSKNKPLYYKIECKVMTDNDYQLRVSPRAKAWSEPSD